MATFYLNHESELYHYGVKGMKWGEVKAHYRNLWDERKKYRAHKKYWKNVVKQDKKKDIYETIGGKMSFVPPLPGNADDRLRAKRNVVRNRKNRERAMSEMVAEQERQKKARAAKYARANAPRVRKEVEQQRVEEWKAKNQALERQNKLRARKAKAAERAKANARDARVRNEQAMRRVLEEQEKRRRLRRK